MSNDDLIKKREVDLGKFWKTGLDLMHQKFLKSIVKDSGKKNPKIGKSVEAELMKAQSKLGMNRKLYK